MKAHNQKNQVDNDEKKARHGSTPRKLNVRREMKLISEQRQLMEKQLCDEIELMQFYSPVKIKDWDRYMQEFRDNQNRTISPLRLLDESRVSVNQQVKEERAS